MIVVRALRVRVRLLMMVLATLVVTGCMSQLPMDPPPEHTEFKPRRTPTIAPVGIYDTVPSDNAVAVALPLQETEHVSATDTMSPTVVSAPDVPIAEPSQPEVAPEPTSPPLPTATPTATPLPTVIEPTATLPATATPLPPTAVPTSVFAEPAPTNSAFVPATPTLPAVASQAAPVAEGVIVPPTLETLALSHEERWRRQQIDREIFSTVRKYYTTGSELWWYDPVQQQHVILGSFVGLFEVQAKFTLRGHGVRALEVPYQVNNRYGLNAISPALVERIQAAGYDEWIETYVIEGPNVQPR